MQKLRKVFCAMGVIMKTGLKHKLCLNTRSKFLLIDKRLFFTRTCVLKYVNNNSNTNVFVNTSVYISYIQGVEQWDVFYTDVRVTDMGSADRKLGGKQIE